MSNDKQTFFLRSEQVRSNLLKIIRQLPLDTLKPFIVHIRPFTRSLEQNAKLHAMLSDIANQCEFQGKKRDIDTWKTIFVSAHKIATGGQVELLTGIEGELINIRESTAQMGVKRMASLIEYITAWGVENGVHFNDKYGVWGNE